MLVITVPETEIYNEETNEFGMLPSVTVQMEHSLISISKWESKWHKVYLTEKAKRTREEQYDYYRCMIINNVSPDIVYRFSDKNKKEIDDYISNPMTATVLKDPPGQYGTPHSSETITSELIYYWMVALEIPFECQKWHINRLLTLIKVCSRKNNPGKKMNEKDLVARNRNLNAARKAKSGTHG